jgi:hypothetical protein
MAFGEGDKDFHKRALLMSFANFGITKLVEMISDDDLALAENLKNFLTLPMKRAMLLQISSRRRR